MDASSAQENSKTSQRSSLRQTTSMQELKFGSRILSSEATEEKHPIGTENVNKGSTDYIGFEQSKPLHEDLINNLSFELLGQQPEDATLNSNPDQLGLLPEDVARKNSSVKQAIPELNHDFVPENVNRVTWIEKQKIGTGNFQNGPAETVTVESHPLGCKQPGPPSEEVTRNCSWEQLRPRPEDERKKYILEQLGLPPEDEPLPDNVFKNCDLGQLELPPEDATNNFGSPSEEVTRNSSWEQLRPLSKDERKKYILEQLGLPPEDEPLPDNVSKNCDLEQLELPPEDATNNSSKSGGRTSGKSTKEKHELRSSVSSTRVLRSRLQEKSKAPEPSHNLAEHGDGANGEKRRKKTKERQLKKIPVDEFSRIRKHLRYLLNRMSYEQILIDAYSGEGWKGQSLEKIKPEKELQRAKSEIFRCKLKIRDLFQRLNLLIAEGRFPESLFDSEGQIDSDDIFCAKCGSKDSPADNDIILCDGACERGFHQFCLEPPLLKEDIPPDDEGWLCPGCDCKVDFINLLNDSQGTNVSILDTWEKVFPEAAVALARNKLYDSVGLISDDSEDNDYDPDGSEEDEKVEGDESSSDESDFYSASEDFGASPNNKQNLELSSDDSADDDYEPGAPDIDEQVKQESSSSDFTSDSEDFSVAFDDGRSPCKDEPMSASSDHTMPFRGSDGERSKVHRRKKQSSNDELLSLVQSGPSQGGSAPVSGKRHIERLDYEKLYDDAYGNVSCDSSDEDWMDADGIPKKRRKNNTEKVALASPGGSTPIIEGTNAKDMKHNQEESEHTPKRMLDVEDTNNSPAKSHKGGSSCSSTKKSTGRRLGEAVTQGLIKSFNENHYPERAMKEKLARELGITVHQVSKWFENARWRFHHSPHTESSIVERVPNKGTPPQTNLSEPGPKMVTEKVLCNGLTMGNSLTEESSRQKSPTPGVRKRKSQ